MSSYDISVLYEVEEKIFEICKQKDCKKLFAKMCAAFYVDITKNFPSFWKSKKCGIGEKIRRWIAQQ